MAEQLPYDAFTYASKFGSHAPNLLTLTHNETIDSHNYASANSILTTAMNYYSISVVGKIKTYAVIIKLFILIAFIFLGAQGSIENPTVVQSAVSQWVGPIKLFAGGMVIFCHLLWF